jgi:hypothetical protein
MTRIRTAFVIFLGCVSVVWAEQPATLTTLRAVHALTNSDANRSIAVNLEATVTYYRGYEYTLFVQDDGVAIFVQPNNILPLVPGDRIRVVGTTRGSFRPIVVGSNISVIRHGGVPTPVPAGFQQLIQNQIDCLFVTIHGTVHSADIVTGSGAMSIILHLVVDGGSIDANVNSDDSSALKGLLDAEVDLTGAESGKFDGKMQQTGVLIHVSSLAGLKVLKRANADPWTLPITSMDEILLSFGVQNLSQRIRVHGTITYFQPGSAAVVQSGGKSLWIMTRSIAPLRLGDEADVTGFPDVRDGFLTVADGEFQDSHIFQPISPQQVTLRELVSSRHLFDLVSIEGQVVTAVREASQDQYVIVSDNYLFSAIYRHPDFLAPGSLSQMRMIPRGSIVRVSGICLLASSNPFGHDVPFDLLIRSFDDITVVAHPSVLTVRNLMVVIGLLLIAVMAASARG